MFRGANERPCNQCPLFFAGTDFPVPYGNGVSVRDALKCLSGVVCSIEMKIGVP